MTTLPMKSTDLSSTHLLLRVDSQVVWLLEAAREHVHHLGLGPHQLHDLLVALQPHGLQDDHDGDVVAQGVVLQVHLRTNTKETLVRHQQYCVKRSWEKSHLPALEEDVAAGLPVVRGGGDCGGHVIFRVQLNDHAVLIEGGRREEGGRCNAVQCSGEKVSQCAMWAHGAKKTLNNIPLIAVRA